MPVRQVRHLVQYRKFPLHQHPEVPEADGSQHQGDCVRLSEPDDSWLESGVGQQPSGSEAQGQCPDCAPHHQSPCRSTQTVLTALSLAPDEARTDMVPG